MAAAMNRLSLPILAACLCSVLPAADALQAIFERATRALSAGNYASAEAGLPRGAEGFAPERRRDG